jgi:hypothetical protein
MRLLKAQFTQPFKEWVAEIKACALQRSSAGEQKVAADLPRN